MAKVRFGTGVAEIRGSVGGSVYSRTHSSAIIRNRIVPVNPNTQPQDDVRSLFSTIAQLYTDLTLAQKLAWEDFAQLVNVTNVFGESYTPTGRQMFQSCNTNLALASSSIQPGSGSGPTYTFAFSPLLGPAMDYYNKPTPPQFDADDKAMAIGLTAGAVSSIVSNADALAPNATDDIQTWIVQATELMRPTIINRKPQFRLLGAYPLPTDAALTLASDWNTRFGGGTYQAGMTAQFRFATVNKGGMRSDWIYTAGTAV